MTPMHPTEEQWMAVKSRYAAGETVQGTVINKSPYGDWIDIGAGCPCLLEIICMEGLTPEAYRAGTYNPVGRVVSARIASFEDDKQIRLTQLP